MTPTEITAPPPMLVFAFVVFRRPNRLRPAWIVRWVDDREGGSMHCETAHCKNYVKAVEEGTSLGQCRAIDAEAFDLTAIFTAGVPTHECPFIRDEVEPLARRRALRRSVEPIEVIAEIVVRALRGAKLPTKPHELNQVVRKVVIDLVRGQIGRMRCSACRSYRDGHCHYSVGANEEPHPHAGKGVKGSGSPRKLDPPCTRFQDRRPTQLQESHQLASDTPSDLRGDVRSAAKRLFMEDAEVAEIVWANKVEGEGMAKISKRRNLTLDQVRGRIQKGLARLRELLDDYEDDREDAP